MHNRYGRPPRSSRSGMCVLTSPGAAGRASSILRSRSDVFNPEKTVVAHKTGLIMRINHDVAAVELIEEPRYILVVSVSGIDEPAASNALIADSSRLVCDYVSSTE